MHGHHGTLQERLEELEKTLGIHIESNEERLGREKARHDSSHETVSERVESLERQSGIFEGLSKEERKAREDEVRRLWNAMDNHTHDLSATVTDEVEVPTPVVKTQIRASSPTISYVSVSGQRRVSQSVLVASPAPLQSFTAYTPAPGSPTMKAMMPRGSFSPLVTTQQPAGWLTRDSSGLRNSRSTSAMATSPMATMSSVPTISSTPSYTVTPVQSVGSVYSAPPPIAAGGSASACAGGSIGAKQSASKRHSVEKVLCGHTRYANEAHSAAEITVYANSPAMQTRRTLS